MCLLPSSSSKEGRRRSKEAGREMPAVRTMWLGRQMPEDVSTPCVWEG